MRLQFRRCCCSPIRSTAKRKERRRTCLQQQKGLVHHIMKFYGENNPAILFYAHHFFVFVFSVARREREISSVTEYRALKVVPGGMCGDLHPCSNSPCPHRNAWNTHSWPALAGSVALTTAMGRTSDSSRSSHAYAHGLRLPTQGPVNSSPYPSRPAPPRFVFLRFRPVFIVNAAVLAHPGVEVERASFYPGRG